MNKTDKHVVALAGGVGGAKLAYGLAQLVSPDKLTIIVNTADDFEHLSLHISPDLDTVMYTLAGLANSKTGWGASSEIITRSRAMVKIPFWPRMACSALVHRFMIT